MQALVIIDMQSEFNSAHDAKTKRSIINQIKKAKSDNIPIVNVSYTGCGDTIGAIKKHLDNYHLVGHTKKNMDNGSRGVQYVIKKFEQTLGEKIEHLIITGVNTEACVLDTCRGLVKKFKLTVIKSGCNSSYYHEFGIERLKGIGANIK